MPPPFRALLVDVWREACQHIEIGEATARIAPMLPAYIPLGLVLIRRMDLKRGCLETVAIGVCGGASRPERTRSDLTPEQMEAIIRWGRAGRAVHGRGIPPAPLIVPPGLRGDVLAGPTLAGGVPSGVLVLVAGRGSIFRPRHLPMLQALLDPFSAALENDRRLREMGALREAAEADKRTLLHRLGRESVGSETIVGADMGLRQVMERIELVAPSDVPVLILGETGSGKEVVARAIHGRSRRAAGPFLRVNCGAIPLELIDSELFGHERGSFTGAVGLRKGWFERADQGTLLLDEIGELPLAAQVRLLRILQDGTFERVGGQISLSVDVRIVAATHRDLQAMVAEGSFREDLWYRIAVFSIGLPPLRDRPEDIPALAAHFALRACRRFGFPALTPGQQEVNLLLAYDWPGNVRELAAVLDRAAILGNGKTLEVAKALGRAPGRPEGSRRRPQDARPRGREALLSLDDAMARHVERALEETRGRIEGPTGAAALLRINPHTLRARMRKLGIDWARYRAV
jgi:transcriptional regulator with GAF, ATPase, and Fis domain